MIDFDSVSLLDQVPVDKIVRTYIGTFDASTQTSTVTGSDGSFKVFTIPHGLTRPMLLDMQWSLNGTTWYDSAVFDASSRSSLAYCTLTDVKIISPVSSGTVYYRVWGLWIDNFDDTNPTVDIESNDESPLIYDSRYNLQKIYLQNQLSVSAGTFGSTQTISVNHDLGYTPNVKAWFEPFSGQVWPLNSGGLSNPYYIDLAQDEAYARIYTNRVDFLFVRFSNAARRAWYRIYYDQT